MSRERVYLVIGADKSIRAARRPQLKANEVAVGIDLTFPDTWGRVVSIVDVAVPDWAPEVEAGDGS